MTLPAVFFFLALVCVAVSSRRPLKGVAESGAEWGVPLPGTVDKTYVWPRPESIEYFRNIGAGVIRVPFLWERLQPRLNGGFNPAYLAALDNAVAKITEANMSAVIDPHNYARFCPGNEAKHGDPSGPCEVIGASRVSIADFAEGFWGKLAAHFASCELCVFALMNEPYGMSTVLWASVAKQTIQAIRAAGASSQLVLVPGNGWTGAHSWMQGWVDKSSAQVSNAQAFDNFTDPANNWAFEMHQYLDQDSRGASPVCLSATVGVEALTNVTAWLEKKGYKAWIGEFAGGNNDLCHTAVDNMLTYMEDHKQAWIGWSWWSAGAWTGTWWNTLEPNTDGSSRPQLAWLTKYLPPAPPPPPPDPCAKAFAKCGGKGWNGTTCCDKGCFCHAVNAYYSQCTPPHGKNTCS